MPAMTREFLVALDGSPGSDAAARRALAVASALGASVTGIHVVDTAQLEASFIADLSGSVGFQPFLNLSGELRRALAAAGEAIVADFEGKREAARVPGSSRVVEGRVVGEIVRAARSAERVFLGLHGTGEGRGKSPGGHADALVRRLAIPTFLSTDDGDPIRRPLAAFDGSDRAVRALRAAAEIAGRTGGRLTVLTVSSSPEEIEARRSAADEALPGLAGAYDFVAAAGHPEDAILARAGENDLIAIGSHGHGRIAELVLGSTTERVLRKTTISVLCVP
jgi:nucleotide-binding universal stress UspA family protein